MPEARAMLHPLRPAFRALAATIVPEAARLDEPGWTEVEGIVAEALSRRPAAVRRQLALFIRALDWLPLFRWGRRFRRLDRERRARFLHGIQNARIFLVRRGFWGLRTLVFMGFYNRRRAYAEVGYDARLRGWLDHPDAPAAAREATLAGLEAGGEPGTPGPSRAPGEAGR